jgi:hypothetical protein
MSAKLQSRADPVDNKLNFVLHQMAQLFGGYDCSIHIGPIIKNSLIPELINKSSNTTLSRKQNFAFFFLDPFVCFNLPVLKLKSIW